MARLDAPAAWRAAPNSERASASDWCGTESAFKSLPLEILGVSIAQACLIHDWEYCHGLGGHSVIRSRLRRNIDSTLRAEGGLFLYPRLALAWWHQKT